VPGCYVTKPRRPVETPAGAGPASLAIAAGANVKVLQTLLGHKTATLDAGPLRAFVPWWSGSDRGCFRRCGWIYCGLAADWPQVEGGCGFRKSLWAAVM